MRPIRMAIIFDQDISVGGGYQQALNALLLVRELSEDLVCPSFFTTIEENVISLRSYGIEASLIQLSLFERLRTRFRRWFDVPRLFSLIKRFERYAPFEKKLLADRIDIVYFLSALAWAQDLEKINYITTVWDHNHRDHPEFPEVRWNRQFEGREKTYSKILTRAVAVFVDSDFAKINIGHRFGVDHHRVYVMPFQPASFLENKPSDLSAELNIQEKYQLYCPYIYYPAFFWPHKNHVYVLDGLVVLERRYGIKIGAIFSGGDHGNREFVEQYARNLKIDDRIRFSGLVSGNEVVSLYRQSVALVMPTYFGAANLPPLEAFKLGTPVLYSDLNGLREWVGDGALLMDLADPASMANHLKELITDESLRSRMVQKGYERLAFFDSMDRVSLLREVLQNFQRKAACWDIGLTSDQ